MADSTVKMEEPVCLIENDNDGNLRVVPESVTILEGIQQPVVVVAVVGLYRTGKSYLMNKLALKQKGFALGATIESKTKGIWMWCVPHPSKPGHTLVLLDTEGLGDVMKGDERNDTWIFCLAVLLSSALVYNSTGTIDNKALENINYVTELTEHINVKTKAKGEDAKSNEFLKVFPSFTWTVRDFTLLLQIDGQPITADEYLEHSLKLLKGDPQKIKQYKRFEEFNRPRECLRKFFQIRKCFVFGCPTTAEGLQRMEELTDAEMEPNFVKQAKEFCDYIYTSAKTKTMIGGLEVTGSMLANLAVMYTKAISSDQIPCLDSAVEALAKIQNCTAVTKAVEHYQTEMARQVTFPTATQNVLSDIHGAVEKEAIKTFMSLSFKDEGENHQTKLMSHLRTEYNEMCKKNIEESRRVCRAVITRVFGPLEKAVDQGSYMRLGGYKHYRENLKKLIQQFKSERGKGFMSEEVLSEYLDRKANVGETIQVADESLSKAEQKREVERVKREAAEQARKVAEEQWLIQKQLIEDQEKSNEEHLKQLAEKIQEEQEIARQENQQLLEAKLAEQKALLDDGFDKKAKGMDENINTIKDEIKEQQKSQQPIICKWMDVAGAGALFVPGVGTVVGGGLLATSKVIEYGPKVWNWMFG